MAPSVREELRRQTRPYHDSIENKLNITETIKSVENYSEFLENFYGFHVPLEKTLVQFVPQTLELDLPTRWKSPLIEQDLKLFNSSVERIQKIPLCTQLPELTTFAQAMGCLYVLEGSTLGGQFLSRHFQKQFGASVGVSYFRAYGPKTGVKWQEFTKFIDTRITEPLDIRDAVETACQTFIAMERWMTRS